jgi:hypothetical protein
MIDPQTGLPKGFVLDDEAAPQDTGLPPGFVLDEPEKKPSSKYRVDKPMGGSLLGDTMSGVGKSVQRVLDVPKMAASYLAEGDFGGLLHSLGIAPGENVSRVSTAIPEMNKVTGKDVVRTAAETPLGAIESLLNVTSGIGGFMASQVTPAVSAAKQLIKPESVFSKVSAVKAAEDQAKVAQALTYEPTTEIGKTMSSVTMAPIGVAMEAREKIMDEMGLPEETKATVRISTDAALAGGGIEGAPAIAKFVWRKMDPLAGAAKVAEAIKKPVPEFGRVIEPTEIIPPADSARDMAILENVTGLRRKPGESYDQLKLRSAQESTPKGAKTSEQYQKMIDDRVDALMAEGKTFEAAENNPDVVSFYAKRDAVDAADLGAVRGRLVARIDSISPGMSKIILDNALSMHEPGTPGAVYMAAKYSQSAAKNRKATGEKIARMLTDEFGKKNGLDMEMVLGSDISGWSSKQKAAFKADTLGKTNRILDAISEEIVGDVAPSPAAPAIPAFPAASSGGIPEWAREQMAASGTKTNRILNDADLLNPDLVELIKKDPVLARIAKKGPELANRALRGNITPEEIAPYLSAPDVSVASPAPRKQVMLDKNGRIIDTRRPERTPAVRNKQTGEIKEGKNHGLALDALGIDTPANLIESGFIDRDGAFLTSEQRAMGAPRAKDVPWYVAAKVAQSPVAILKKEMGAERVVPTEVPEPAPVFGIIGNAEAEMAARPPKGSLGIVPPGFGGNTVPLTPAQAKVMSGKSSGRPNVFDKAKETAGKIPYYLWDQFDPIKKFVKDAEASAGKPMTAEADPYVNFTQLSGRYDLMQDARWKLRDAVRGAKGLFGQFESYVTSMRMLERANNGVSNPKGITSQDAAKSLLEMRSVLGPKKTAQIVRTGKKFWDWTNKEIIQRLVDGKVISKKGADQIRKRNQYWLPFEYEYDRATMKAIDDAAVKLVDIDSLPAGSDYAPLAQKAIFSMTGAPKNLDYKPPFETVLKRLDIAVNLAEMNRARFNLVATRTKSKFAQDMIKPLKRGETPGPGFGEFSVIINGKVTKWTAPEEVIMSVNSIKPSEFAYTEKIMGLASRLFTAGTTGYYLPFSLMNFPRDVRMAIKTSKYGFSPKSAAVGIINAIPSAFGVPTPLYRDYLRSRAGSTGLMSQKPTSNVKDVFGVRKINYMKALNPFSTIANIGRAVELTPRLGVFYNARKAVGPGAEAGMAAMNSTTNFKGGGVVTRSVGRLLPFLNARVQVKRAMLESLTSTAGWRKGQANVLFGIKGDPRVAYAARAVMLGVLPSAALYFYNRTQNDDVYEQIPDEYKEKYDPIITGTGANEDGRETVNVVLIPKDDVSSLLWNPVQHFLDFAWKKEPKKLSEVATKFLNDWSPIDFEKDGKVSLSRLASSAIPPVAKAVVEPAANRDLYFDKPIVPQRLQDVEPKYQFDKNTTELYKYLGDRLNMSPMKLQKAAINIFGRMATAVDPADIVKQSKSKLAREIETKTLSSAYDLEGEAKRGYATTRLKMEQMLEAGDMGGATNLALDWNRKMSEWAQKMATTVGADGATISASPMYRQYSFQSSDIKSLIRSYAGKKAGVPSGIDKRLGVKVR